MGGLSIKIFILCTNGGFLQEGLDLPFFRNVIHAPEGFYFNWIDGKIAVLRWGVPLYLKEGGQ